MHFKDRIEATQKLLPKLEKYRGTHPLVLGIPRGAVPMAKIIADALEGELGIVLVHKIPAPSNEELAIGSIGLSGHIQRLPLIEMYSIPEHYVQAAAKQQMELLNARQQKYGLKEPNYQNRTVIIVDDGIATGATTLSAVHEVRNYKPNKIILAAPVASIDAAEKLAKEVDELVVLDTPWEFYAVGQFYDIFNQVTDEEVINILERYHGTTGDKL